jgi:uncharacterized membrane protein YphA (DoxX/SURF4 family)
MSLVRAVVVWVLSVLVAALFAFAGAAKFFVPEMAAKFHEWGYPDWFHYVVGAAELGGAVLLLVPRAAWIGAAVLALIMAGAVWTLVTHNQAEQVPVPAVTLVVLLVLVYLRRPRAAAPAVSRP